MKLFKTRIPPFLTTLQVNIHYSVIFSSAPVSLRLLHVAVHVMMLVSVPSSYSIKTKILEYTTTICSIVIHKYVYMYVR